MSVRLSSIAVLALSLCLPLGGPVAARAGDASPLPGKVFEVTLTDTSGAPRNSFYAGDEAVFNVSFGLMLSDVRPYPVRVEITIGGDTITAFENRLDEGLWLVTQKVKVLANWKPGTPWKALLKVRMTNRSDQGTMSYYAYYKAEGTLNVQ